MRKTKGVTITTEGRDKGKTFLLTEMPARQAEKWGTRALLTITRSGVNLPEDIAEAGMVGVALAGLQLLSNINFHDAEPLLDEMLTCVQFIPDPNNKGIVRFLHDSDIEEVKTIIQLRVEVLSLHTDFSFADFQSKLRSLIKSAGSQNMQTSQEQSEP